MNEEIIQLCDLKGRPCGTSPRSVCHKDPSLIQMVVHLVVMNSEGSFFLQKRAMNKEAFPGYWDTSVGGHVSGGESLMQALTREADEEIGIELTHADFVFKKLYFMENETEMSFFYKTVYDGPFMIDNDEVTEGRFFTAGEISPLIGTNIFTPSLENGFLAISGN